jgi:hypothetical protein
MGPQIVSKVDVVAKRRSTFNDNVKVMLGNIARRVKSFAAGDPEIAPMAIAKPLQPPNGFRNIKLRTYYDIQVDSRFANQALHRRTSHMFDGNGRIAQRN